MTFDMMLHQLSTARTQYEAMRSSGAPVGQLVEAQVGLLYLRAEIARLRRELR